MLTSREGSAHFAQLWRLPLPCDPHLGNLVWCGLRLGLPLEREEEEEEAMDEVEGVEEVEGGEEEEGDGGGLWAKYW